MEPGLCQLTALPFASIMSNEQGRIAQPGERFAYTEEVTGSSPVSPNNNLAKVQALARFCFCTPLRKVLYYDLE